MRCSPVKNGWQTEQTSMCIDGFVERVSHELPHEHVIVAVWYSGGMSVFMALLSEPDGPNRCWSGLNRLDGYLLATALRVGGEADDAVHPRPQRVVLTQAHVVARVHARAALPH